MVGGILRIKYTGAQASCLLEADTTAETLTSKIGAAGAEAVDPNFGVAGVMDLTAAAYDTVTELQALIAGYADYSAEIYYTIKTDIVSIGIEDVKLQAKSVWAYIPFTITSVLDTANSLVTWALVKEMLDRTDAEQTKIERIINAVSRTANRISGRYLKTRAYTKILDGTGTATVNLGEYPVNSITKLYQDGMRVFGASTEIAATDYARYDEIGSVQLYSGTFPSGIKTVKAIFDAGLGYGGAQIPEDLQFAALEAVEWNAKRFLGALGIGEKSKNMGEGVTAQFEITIPLNAQRVFEAYARRFI